MMRWIPIRYRDFYDIPRAFVIEYGGETFLFDCPFDNELDDYPAHYIIVRLDPSVTVGLDEGSWQDLSAQGSVVGRVPTSVVEFDNTKRAAVNAVILEQLDRSQPPQ